MKDQNLVGVVDVKIVAKAKPKPRTLEQIAVSMRSVQEMRDEVALKRDALTKASMELAALSERLTNEFGTLTDELRSRALDGR